MPKLLRCMTGLASLLTLLLITGCSKSDGPPPDKDEKPAGTAQSLPPAQNGVPSLANPGGKSSKDK